jgi:hypothetical protein
MIRTERVVGGGGVDSMIWFWLEGEAMGRSIFRR